MVYIYILILFFRKIVAHLYINENNFLIYLFLIYEDNIQTVLRFLKLIYNFGICLNSYVNIYIYIYIYIYLEIVLYVLLVACGTTLSLDYLQ